MAKTEPKKAKTLANFTGRFNRDVSAPTLVAEAFGTFVLTGVALFANGDAFFTGLTLAVLAMAIYAVSGSHLNPAITFGLWSVRKLPGMRVLFYWAAQFVGAIGAVVLLHLFNGEPYSVSFSSFGSLNAQIFFAELVGAVVFAFGVAAAVSRDEGIAGRAAAIGLSLTVGLIIATGLLSAAVTNASTSAENASQESRLSKVGGAALNPAIAFAMSEKDASASAYNADGSNESKTQVSRLTLETILGPLAGAAIGANLYRLVGRKQRA